jgi:DNA-binding CsgD family transcriptional regulator
MTEMEIIKEVRVALANHKSERWIAKQFHLSRNTVSKIKKLGLTEFKYPPRKIIGH